MIKKKDEKYELSRKKTLNINNPEGEESENKLIWYA